MQAFKTLLIVAVLSIIAYGVYAALTGARDVEPPPGATADDWQAAPQIELPAVDPTHAGAPASLGAAEAARMQSSSQPQVVQPQPPAAEAPRYDAPTAHQDSGAAPPFVAPSVGPSDSSALPAAAAPNYPLSPGQVPPHDPAAGGFSDPQPSTGDGAQMMPQEASRYDTVAPIAGAPADSNFATDWAAAGSLLQENRLDPALLLLSRWYDDPRLSDQEHQALTTLLNQLAGTVIYSRDHLLLPSYEVQPGDTLERIAQHYKVPWQLLAKINSVPDPNHLRPGEQLKVVQGPFDAHVNLRARQLTMMLGGRFAGRFPIGVGAEQSTPEGEFTVKVKTPNPTYYGPDRVIDAGDPTNPLGQFWIGLDDHLGIHGTNDPASIGQADSRGCIRLSPRDIEDVYDMMTAESRVRILR